MQRTARTLTIMVLAAVASCGGGDGGSMAPTTTRSVNTTLLGVRAVVGTQTLTGALRTGAAPAAVGGATVTTQRVGALLPGGSSQVRLSSRTAFTRAIVAIDGTTDYYEVTLPTADTVALLTLTVAQQPPQTAFQLRYATGAGTNVSTYATENVTLTNVGTGAVQVSVNWATASDVDLYLVEPGGREVYFGAPTSTAGAQLDLDSNAGCALDNRNNENITYGAGRTPPTGQYVVRVNYWSACSVTGSTTYVVTVTVRGVTQTFSGTLTGRGNQGGAGAGVEVTRFTF